MQGNKSIYSALASDLIISVIKFIAGGFSHSTAMISEGVHSLVDSANQLLILLGLERSKKKPDATHPFGYGKELYFWSFVVSILIFGLGGGIAVYQGILQLMNPHPLEDPFWNYIVLAASFLFEGASLAIAIREFDKLRDGLSWWQAIKKSKDPSTFLVLFEDSSAVLGLTIVGICLFLGHRYNVPRLDGIASLLVGLVLLVSSSLLARESRSLLMGEGISNETKKKIIALAEKDPTVIKVKTILSSYQAPDTVLLMVMIAFKPELDTEDINRAVVRIRTDIKEEFKLVQYVLIQPSFENADTSISRATSESGQLPV